MIALAQIDGSDTHALYDKHVTMIEQAYQAGATTIVFPEMSLTGYRTHDANEYGIKLDDEQINNFVKLSELHKMTIVLGIPLKEDSVLYIAQAVIAPDREPKSYKKNILHADEKPYFGAGAHPYILRKQNKKYGLAICYESLQREHIDLYKNDIDGYIASVAKTASAMDSAIQYYKTLARERGIPILVANSTGYQDNFMAGGKSAIISSSGLVVEQLTEHKEGIILYR